MIAIINRHRAYKEFREEREDQIDEASGTTVD